MALEMYVLTEVTTVNDEVIVSIAFGYRLGELTIIEARGVERIESCIDGYSRVIAALNAGLGQSDAARLARVQESVE